MEDPAIEGVARCYAEQARARARDWLACLKNGRKFIGIELNPQYIDIANKRALNRYSLFAAEAAQ